MTKAATRNRSPAKSASLVWFIVVLGLGIGAFTLCTVRATLNGIRAQRTQLAATQDAADNLSADLGRAFEDSRSELQRLLAGQSDTNASQEGVIRIDESLTRFGSLLQGKEASEVAGQAKAFLEKLRALHERCVKWNKDNADNLTNLGARKKTIEASMLQMRAALSSAEGRRGLELAAKIRHFRKLTDQPAQKEAASIISELGTNAEITEIPVEVSNLALLCQQLIGEDEIDHLADLKDNLFLASLSRLSSLVARCASDSILQHDMKVSSEAFEQYLFGTGCSIDSDHQTILVESDGLYSICRHRLELRQDHEVLRTELARRSDDYARTAQRLDTLGNVIKDGITSTVQASLSRVWRNLLILMIVCGAVLVVVGQIIAANIKRQFILIAETTAGLQRSNAQMAAIHHTSLDCVLVLNSQWRIVNFNPAAERAFKCNRREALGRGLPEFVIPPPNGQSEGFQTSGETSVLGKLIEVTAKRPDSSTFPSEIAITAAEMDGPPVYIASLRDLTERKKADAEREEFNDRLLKATRHAGMAEVATGVLHNVGNVLNSVNVSASVIAEKVRQSEVASLTQVSEMIGAHPEDLATFLTEDERGKLVPGFIVELAKCLGQEQADVLHELSSLANGIDHIKQIVSAQQSLAKKGTVRTSTDPVKLMETALTMQGGMSQRDGIEVVRQFEEIPNLLLDQHKIVQILVNLITNARHAVKSSENQSRKISLAIETAENNQGKLIRFVVGDNGVGIAPHHLTRVFSHGFTTKADGHGFGLHSAANAATEMGGTLTAASDGLGKGSTFTLELPVVVGQKEELCNP